MLIKKNTNISKFIQLITFLKRKLWSKKLKILRKEDVIKFLKEANEKFGII